MNLTSFNMVMPDGMMSLLDKATGRHIFKSVSVHTSALVPHLLRIRGASILVAYLTALLTTFPGWRLEVVKGEDVSSWL